MDRIILKVSQSWDSWISRPVPHRHRSFSEKDLDLLYDDDHADDLVSTGFDDLNHARAYFMYTGVSKFLANYTEHD